MVLLKTKHMKTIIISILIFASASLMAQEKYITRTGHVSFFSEAPMENIEAHNHQVTSILNVTNGDMVFSMLMKGFEFEKALMQEHFNESYVESEKFPKSTFKGSIQDFDMVNLKEGQKTEVEVKGDLKIHGVTKEYNVTGTIEKKEGNIMAYAQFPIKVADHDIKIPAGKVNNIAEEVEVTVDLSYEPYGK